jgi:hypothetical protein
LLFLVDTSRDFLLLLLWLASLDAILAAEVLECLTYLLLIFSFDLLDDVSLKDFLDDHTCLATLPQVSASTELELSHFGSNQHLRLFFYVFSLLEVIFFLSMDYSVT